MPKHKPRSLTRGCHFWIPWPCQSAPQALTSEWWSWPFSEVKKHSQYFRAHFQSCYLNPRQRWPVCIPHIALGAAFTDETKVWLKHACICLFPAGMLAWKCLGESIKKATYYHVRENRMASRLPDHHSRKAKGELWWPGGLGRIPIFAVCPCQLGQVHS